MRIIKRISRTSANRLIRARYTIYNNEKLIICKKYGKYKFNFEEILDAFKTLVVGIGNILYSIILLIIAIFGFIPTINIIKEENEESEIDEEMRNRFNK